MINTLNFRNPKLRGFKLDFEKVVNQFEFITFFILKEIFRLINLNQDLLRIGDKERRYARYSGNIHQHLVVYISLGGPFLRTEGTC